MVTPTYPGVYVEEVSSGVRPITLASTSTAAFIGQAERGSLVDAVKIYNFTQFQNLYGGFMTNSYLAHSVYQFFNNGGSQCYIVRVAGGNVETAEIGLSDRAEAPATTLLSLTVSTLSPGFWGNHIEIVVEDGTTNPGNEFNLKVYWENEEDPLETYEDVSLVPTAPNFVETSTSRSNYVRVKVNPDIIDGSHANLGNGSSRGAGVPTVPSAGSTRMQINIDNDGYREIDILDGTASGTPADLSTIENVCLALQNVVQGLTKQRVSTNQEAYDNFTCEIDADTGALVLNSGTTSVASAVNVSRASDTDADATGFLRLGPFRGGIETLGGAVARPSPNTEDIPRYLVGDHNTPSEGVIDGSVVAGSDGAAILDDKPFIDALNRLDDKEDVSLIAAPGRGSCDMVGSGMNYCANTQHRPLRDCFFIGDMGPDDYSVDLAKDFVAHISPKNSYGAVYVPWILMLDPTGRSSEPIRVPPSGFVAGLYAKTDARRGVWKAPAGIEAALGGSVGLEKTFTDVEQGNLNPAPYNVNVIRQFAASGYVIWGARTVTSDAEWRYIPVRRMAILLRVSIYRGIQWAVFEPNDEELWAQLRLNIGAFMMTLFRQGAFQGNTPSKAFFVKCDSETTTQIDIDQGIVNVLVGFAPLKPAEFVMVKISQKAGHSS
jgi:phage tail sheath protein FI